MGRTLAYSIFLLVALCSAGVQAQWTWVFGDRNDTTPLNILVPGTWPLTPSGRWNPTMVSDEQGNSYFFGGHGLNLETMTEDYKSDLWKVSPGGVWTFLSGPNTTSDYGVFGTKGVANAKNIPGARYGGALFIDSQAQNLYLFGGYCADSTGSEDSCNDVWQFNLVTKLWTWLSGASTFAVGKDIYGVYGPKGVASTNYHSGGRAEFAYFIHPTTKIVYLFGGYGYAADKNTTNYGDAYVDFDDLWSFNPVTREWAFLSGSNGTTDGSDPVYGVKGQASPTNNPGSRYGSYLWPDPNSNNGILLYGGVDWGYDYRSDLWRFDLSTLIWTWIGGDNVTDTPPTFGTIGMAGTGQPGARRHWGSTAVDGDGVLWLIGDEGAFSGYQNDLWKYTAAGWTWVAGNTSAPARPYYATKGVQSGAFPGPCYGTALTVTGTTLRTFAGWNDPHSNNDLFEMQIPRLAPVAPPMVSPASIGKAGPSSDAIAVVHTNFALAAFVAFILALVL